MTSQRTRDRLIARLRKRGIEHPGVLEVMRSLPRHLFVDEALASHAYEETALPIGYRQTISQPYVVAYMTQALMAGDPERVLEVGTGSGYQTAVLAQLVAQVYSVERIEGLLRRARQRFHELRLHNVRLKHSDGNWGWEAHAPYDAILVTAAPEEIPESLCRQLRIGGRMVVPVGDQKHQKLLAVQRLEDRFEVKTLEMVSFVPMLGGTG